MDQVTVPRATVQQALEALEGGGESWRLIGPAIDALRAALAEPVQEPVDPAYKLAYKLIGCVQHDCEECQRRTQRHAEPEPK
jgi:hypothetical protein